MDELWEVAVPLVWAILSLASVFLLTGFVLLSHTLVRRKAYGDDYHGATGRGRLESTVRAGAGCLLVGFGLWAYPLGAPVWVLVGLGAGAAVAFGLEAVAVGRGRG